MRNRAMTFVLAALVGVPAFAAEHHPRGPGFVSHHRGGELPDTNTVPQGQTTDLTPLLMNTGPSLPADSVCRIPIYVFGSAHNGDVASWYWLVTARRVDTDPPTMIVGTPDVKKSSGAATWTATLAVANGVINATVTGALGATVDWMQNNDDPYCMVGPYTP